MVCAAIGLFAALLPSVWLRLFSSDDEVIRIGTQYLQITGPIYGFFGVGPALFFAAQGFGSVVWNVAANAIRLLVSAVCALAGVYWFDLGIIGFSLAIAGGFCLFAALSAGGMLQFKDPPVARG